LQVRAIVGGGNIWANILTFVTPTNNDEEPTMKENTFEADPGGGYTYSHVIDGLGKEAAKLI
jgi:hypothetical protein